MLFKSSKVSLTWGVGIFAGQYTFWSAVNISIHVYNVGVKTNKVARICCLREKWHKHFAWNFNQQTLYENGSIIRCYRRANWATRKDEFTKNFGHYHTNTVLLIFTPVYIYSPVWKNIWKHRHTDKKGKEGQTRQLLPQHTWQLCCKSMLLWNKIASFNEVNSSVPILAVCFQKWNGELQKNEYTKNIHSVHYDKTVSEYVGVQNEVKHVSKPWWKQKGHSWLNRQMSFADTQWSRVTAHIIILQK